MKNAHAFQVVFVTVPDRATARKIARAALEARLIACANIVPSIESHYLWQGKLDASKEFLMVFKTTRRRLAELEKLVLQLHPYDTPEFISVQLGFGAAKYLAWIQDSVK